MKTVITNPSCIANCSRYLIENNLCDCYNRGAHPGCKKIKAQPKSSEVRPGVDISKPNSQDADDNN